MKIDVVVHCPGSDQIPVSYHPWASLRDYGECPDCGEFYKVRKDHKIRKHPARLWAF